MLKQSIVFFIAVVSFSVFLSAEQVKISVSGNERTESNFIFRLTETCIEDQGAQGLENVDPDQLKERIINSKLFSEVEISNDASELLVVVKERWSLIPIPIINSESGKETTFGLFVMERNFLGIGKTVALGGTTSSENGMMFIMYEDPAVLSTNWKIKFNLGTSKNQIFLYDGEDEIDGINSNTTFFNGALGYLFMPGVSASVLLNRSINQYKQLETYLRPDDFAASSLGIELIWDKSMFRFYYQEGFSNRVKLVQQVERSDEADFSTHFQLMVNWQSRTVSNQAIQLGFVYAATENADVRTALRIGSQTGTRGILDKGVWAEAYAAFSIDYQFPLMIGSNGTWTVAPFMDNGSIRLVTSGNEIINYTAYGLGTYYFLKEVAIPGIGLIIGKNDNYQQQFYKITIGFDF